MRLARFPPNPRFCPLAFRPSAAYDHVMNYQVLARKWRPHNFSEVVGQQHVVKTLINALQNQRLHHAYLFTGTRGVGKTTIARILAKAINCENLQGFEPCGECDVCKDLDAGRFLDLIEVDAASRTKVEDTRELLDNAQYTPNQGRYKVYLIDEVHMLSGHSFNALLKTLEEPPPHVKFLLATTDPQKIPVTVLSRCLQFNLKRLLPEQISKQLGYILEQEKITFEAPALRQLARAADGSMRDALSLLDQAIVFGEGKVQQQRVLEMLGTLDTQAVEALLMALVRADAAELLTVVAGLAELTPDFADVLQQLLYLLHRIALAQVVPEAAEQEDQAALIRDLAGQLPAEDVQLYYQIALKGQQDLDLAPDARSGFEMVMLRMLAFRPAVLEDIKQAGQAADKKVRYSAEVQASAPEKSTTTAAKAMPSTDDWPAMIKSMRIGAMTRELANNCILERLNDKQCVLLLDPGHQQLLSSRTEEKLQQALQKHVGKAIKLTINVQQADAETPAVQLNKARENRQQAAVDAIAADETVQALKDTFDARVIPGSIEPL